MNWPLDKSKRIVLLTSVILALLMGTAWQPASAQDLADSLEEELLKGLGDDLLKPQAEPDRAPRAALPGGEQEPAGEDIGMGPEDDPLVRIGKRMRIVEQMIAGCEQLKQAPERQQQIVKDLEELIRQLRRQQQSHQQASANSTPMGSERSKVQPPGQQEQQAGRDPGSSGDPSNRPARDSTERLGRDEAQQVDMAEMQSLLKDLWGHLPDRTREQMLQSSVEEFLPKYEVMIEKYFRRLAEDQQRDESRP